MGEHGNLARTFGCCLALLVIGGLICFSVRATLAGHYDVYWPYIISVLTVTVVLFLLMFFWNFLTTTNNAAWAGARSRATNGGIPTLLYVLLAWMIAAISFGICNTVRSSSGSKEYTLYAVFILPAAFTALMYGFPPIDTVFVILPGNGAGQKVVRAIIALAMACIVAGLWIAHFA